MHDNRLDDEIEEDNAVKNEDDEEEKNILV